MRLLPMAVLGLLCLHQSDVGSDTTTISRFFDTFVVDGSVNHQGIKDEPEELQELVSVLANANSALLSSMDAAKAFWINAHIDYFIEFVPYDWRLNDIGPVQTGEPTTADVDLQAFTPGKLLLPGQIEVKEFWNLYTQTAYFDDNGERRDSDGRSTYFTATTSILYGIARRWNVGLDCYLKAVQNDNDPDSSPFEVLTFPSDDNARAAFTAIAPKVKVSPFEWAPTLSLQTAVVVPLANDLENYPFLDYDGVQWWTQLFYDYSVGEDFLLYLEGDCYWRVDSDAESFVTPLKAIFQHYPSSRWVVYALGELAPSWDDGKRNAYYTQLGIGVKHQPIPCLEFEFLAGIFPAGENKGAGSTLNLGIRLLK